MFTDLFAGLAPSEKKISSSLQSSSFSAPSYYPSYYLY